MPKVKYDVTDVEDGGDFKQAPKGVYIAKIADTTVGESGAGQPMLTIVLELTKDAKGKKLKEKYGRIWHRVPLVHWEDTAGWTFRLKEFIKALGLKEKGSLDPDKLVGETLQVSVRAGKDLDGEYRAEAGKLMRLPEGDDDDEEPEDEPEDDDTDDDDDDGAGEEYTEEDLDGMDDDDLREAAEEFDVKVPKGKLTKAKKAKVVAAILEAQDEDDDSEDDDDDDDDDDEEPSDYSEMSKKELVAEARSRGIKVKTGMDEDDIIAALEENDSEDDDDDDDDDDGDDDESYDDWSIEDLKAEAKERGLKTGGSKKALVKRLEDDDESDEEPF